MDKLNTQLIRIFKDKLNNSYNTYRNEIIQDDKWDIFKISCQIHFYECVFNYLQMYTWDNGAVHKTRLELLNKQQDILNSLWNTYLETEWLNYTTWEEMNDLMSEFYKQNNIS